MADPESNDEFPNDFDGLDFDNIPGLQAPTANNPPPQLVVPSMRSVARSAAASPTPSNGWDSFDDMDPSFLAAVDEIEARAIGEMSRGSTSSVRADSGPSENICSLPAETTCVPGTEHRKRSVSPDSFSTNRKGKRKAESQDEVDVRAVLEGYETELTCPICCDILVGAQVANPCGHTCCGECGYGWLDRNKFAPSCATCRCTLSAKKPLLPNFALDNLVRQHLHSLATIGRPEWQEKGYRYIEWNNRLASWKKQAAARAVEEKSKDAARLRRRQHYRQGGDYAYVPPWLVNEVEDEEEGEEEVFVSRIMTRRGTRARH